MEDSESDFAVLGTLLEEYGVEAALERVEDDPGMRAALASRAPDVVLCDHRLPRFSLERALRTLKAHDPDIPLIVVSGAIGEEAAVDAMLAGADDFIMKDNMARLPAALRRSIASAETRRRQRRAEAALRESEGLLRSIADNLPVVMLRLAYDRQARTLSLNYAGGAAVELLGLRPNELREESGALMRVLEPRERAEFLARVEAAAAEGASLSWEGRLPAAGGGRWIQLQGTLRSRDAGHARWDAVAFDVSGLKRAEAEVRELTAHLEDVKERERAAAAREIHDDIGALFFGLKVDLAWLRKRAGGDAALRQRLESIDAQLESGVQASHRIVRALRPAVLDFGVVGAAEWLARDFAQRTGVPCDFSSSAEEIELAPELGTALFRVLQESLTNVSRHAGASRVAVRLAAQDGEVRLEVEDDGRGVTGADLGKRASFGLRGMRERARELGGSLEVGPAARKGTRLRLSLPSQRVQGDRA